MRVSLLYNLNSKNTFFSNIYENFKREKLEKSNQEDKDFKYYSDKIE
jgi:hypothetical protein